ncbi:unnamed protein product [Gongylonema pulchrum]|uniref:Uncharacterized protein n=1 Tax=Gongylonema pulchrum TaxID=637853 RepID=A0A183DQI0_9BILA|nr:unnamed protein product [Gongylonema pulchrum]
MEKLVVIDMLLTEWAADKFPEMNIRCPKVFSQRMRVAQGLLYYQRSQVRTLKQQTRDFAEKVKLLLNDLK